MFYWSSGIGLSVESVSGIGIHYLFLIFTVTFTVCDITETHHESIWQNYPLIPGMYCIFRPTENDSRGR